MNLQQQVAGATSGQQAAGAFDAKSSGSRLASRLAWLTWALSIVFLVLALSISYTNGPSTFFDNIAVNALGVPTLFVYATVGALIASRRPQNVIGWTFCGAALLASFGTFAEEYAHYALITAPGSLPGGWAMAWLSRWTLDAGLFVMFTFLLLLFPDGKLPSARWRPVAWIVTAGIIVLTLLDVFRPGHISTTLPLDNPLGSAGAWDLIGALWDPLLAGVIVMCSVSVIMRFRVAGGDERQQLKWFAYAAVLSLAQIFARIMFSSIWGELPDSVGDALLVLSLAAFPIAAGIAILKYRLYDIDLLINRTLVYVPLTGILAGVYAASIALFQKLFVGVTGEKSDAAIVLTTLVLASSFTPIKNGLQVAVDRRFKEIPDPTKRLRVFGEQVKSFVQMNSAQLLTKRLLDEVTSAFGASGGAVYLEVPVLPEIVHTSGDWTGDEAVSLPLQREGVRFGLISLAPRINGGEYTHRDRQVLQEIVDAVAQAVEIAKFPG